MNELTPNQFKVIDEGNKAQAIFDNEFFREKVNLLEQTILNSWKTAQTTEEREQLWLKLQAIKDLIVELKIPLMMNQQLQHQLQNQQTQQ